MGLALWRLNPKAFEMMDGYSYQHAAKYAA